MAAEYAEHGVGFAFVYVREAHPGERYPHHESFEQKLQHARDMVQQHDIGRPMLVDDLEGSVHHAYGRLPNMSYIVDGGGKIVYRAAWTDARNLKIALDELLHARAERRGGSTTRPFYVEWQVQAPLDRVTFVQRLLEDSGPKAVQEYIAAIGETFGDAAARPLRRWWSEAGDSITA